MTGRDSEALPAVVGRQVRALRDAAGVTAEQVANAARVYGLGWTRSKVADLERGAKPLQANEFLVLPMVLKYAGCDDVRMTDLLPSSTPVALTPRLRLDSGMLQLWLAGSLTEQQRRRMYQAQADASLARRAREFPDAGPAKGTSRWEDAQAAVSDTDRRVAKTLGCTPLEVVLWSWSLWQGRTLAEERDRRLGKDTSDKDRRALRGRITRTLTAHLRDNMTKEGKDDGSSS